MNLKSISDLVGVLTVLDYAIFIIKASLAANHCFYVSSSITIVQLLREGSGDFYSIEDTAGMLAEPFRLLSG